MASFQEISDQLGKALNDVVGKKKALDGATAVVQKANTEYSSSVEYAQGLKDQLVLLLNDSLPNIGSQTRIR